MPPLLRENPRFRRFWLGQTISLLGDQVSLIALPLVAVLSLDASAAQMGYLVAAELAPNLLFSLHAGAWVDRRGRKRQTMIATDLGRALLIGSLPLAYAFDALTFPHMLVVAFLIGTLSVLFQVSYSSLFVALVPRERFVEGGSIMHGSRALSYVAGPSIGGAARAGALGAGDARRRRVLVRRLGALPPRASRSRSRRPRRPGKGHVVAGVRWVFGNPIVRAALGATATINFFNFVFFALFILYATKSLDVEPGTLGLVLGAGAVGGVIGSLVTGRVAGRIGIGPAFAVGCVALPGAAPARAARGRAALGRSSRCLFLAEFGAGLGVMMLDISVGAIFAAVIPDRLRSRVSGAYMVVNYGVRPLGRARRRRARHLDRPAPTLWIATAGALARDPLAAAVADPRAPGRCRSPRRRRRLESRLSTWSLTASAASFADSQASSPRSFALS